MKILFRIAQNHTSVAIIERNSQCAHIYDKKTKKKIDEVENLLRTKGIFRLWNVLVSLNYEITIFIIIYLAS